MIGEQASGFDLRGHVGELELDGLKFGDGFAELFALLGVAHRAFVGALRHAQAERGDGNAAAIENLQAVDEAFAFFAEKIFGGNAAIGEDDFAGVARAQAELVFFFPGRKPGVPFSMMNAEMPWLFFAASVTAMPTQTSA